MFLLMVSFICVLSACDLQAMKRSVNGKREFATKVKRNKSEPLLQKIIDAIRAKNVELAKALLDIELTDSSETQNYGIKEVALICAIEEQCEELVKVCLDKGANVNICAPDGSAPVLKAAKTGVTSLVKLLLERGAKVNGEETQGGAALLEVIEHGEYTAAELLLKSGAYCNVRDSSQNTALMNAVLKRDEEWVALLLKYGADINLTKEIYRSWPRVSTSALDLAVCEERLLHLDLLKESMSGIFDDNGGNIFKNEERYKAYQRVKKRAATRPDSSFITNICQLLRASAGSATQTYRNNPIKYIDWHIEHCFKKGQYVRSCDVNPQVCLMSCQSSIERYHPECTHHTVLMLAAMFGDKQGVEKILAQDVPLWYLNAQDKYERTALMYAILYKHTDIALLLIQAYEKEIEKVRVVLESQKLEPLERAQYDKALEKAKRALNITDKDHAHALTYALKKGDSTLVTRLVKAGARPTVQSIKQAILYGHNQLAVLLMMSFLHDAQGTKYPHIL